MHFVCPFDTSLTLTHNLHPHSYLFSDRIKEAAEECYKAYMVVGCDEEVNICAATRKKFDDRMKLWMAGTPVITNVSARHALEEDQTRRVEVFETAYKEISIMLYQNIWLKFRAAEIEDQMGAEGEGGKDPSGKDRSTRSGNSIKRSTTLETTTNDKDSNK